MDLFTAEKFGSDNASSMQNKEIDLQELAAIAEETLEEQQATNSAVHEESGPEDEEDLEEISDYPDYDATRDQDLLVDAGEEDEDDIEPGQTYEESLDYRWFREEYLLLNEAVDWEAIESDPEQLFTIGNSKVGMDTIIFNLQPARFCPSFENGMCQVVKAFDGQFKIACYAYQDERQYKTALQLRIRQMRYWDTHSADEIFEKLADFYHLSKGDALVHKMWKAPDKIPGTKKKTPAVYGREKDSIKLQFIRFNQSGDLKGVADAKKMDKIAKRAKEELNLITYTYTARKDVLAKYKFQHVHIQGSGFSAITGINRPVKTKKGITIYGKTFKAYPSLFNRKGKLLKREAGVLYYEDIMDKTIADTGKENPHYDLWSPHNKGGWFPCKGDCNRCNACKSDDVKLIACKIHRSHQKISAEWHDVKTTKTGGYRVKPKFDVYQGKGYGKTWSPEMEAEYEERGNVIQAEKDFRKKPMPEQVAILTKALRDRYEAYDPGMNGDQYDDWKDDLNKWEKKAEKRDIDWRKIKAEYPLPKSKRDR